MKALTLNALASLGIRGDRLAVAARKTGEVMAQLDGTIRRMLNLPPAHYNPPPMFGLRAAWPKSPRRRNAQTQRVNP